jgi:hypothetical protein
MQDLNRVEIEAQGSGWVVRVIAPGLRPQEYYCATRAQADSLAAVMTGAKQAGRIGVPARGTASNDSPPPPLPRSGAKR